VERKGIIAMSKTTVHFLRKNRTIKKVKIKASEGFLEFFGGFYIVSADAINRISKNGLMTKGSEIFFFEGNSSPIPFIAPKENDADPSSEYLNDMVYVNFLEQTGAPSPEKFKNAMKWIKPVASPGGMMKLLLFVLLIGTLARGWILSLV
jgi:hypothetical protein